MRSRASNAAQKDIRRWWNENPMTYDWRERIGAEPGSPEHLEEVERRFLVESWFAQEPGAAPYSGLVDFPTLKDKDVLEVGCGSGVHARLFAESGARLSAVDLTTTAVDLTRRRLAIHGLEADVREADAENLPFDDASFDFVWSWGVIHHSSSTECVLAEIARVLRPGGRLTFMVYHRSSITYWFNYVIVHGVLGGRLLRSSPAEIADQYSDGVVARHFTRKELERVLDGNFTDVRTEVMGQLAEAVPLPARFRPMVANWIPESARRRLLRRYGWFVVASARRRP